MKKENITILCSTIISLFHYSIIPLFVIGVIALLIWTFRTEVMDLLGKLKGKSKEKCGEWIGSGKKVEDVEKSAVEAHNTKNGYGSKSSLSYETLDKVDAGLGRMIDNNQGMQVKK